MVTLTEKKNITKIKGPKMPNKKLKKDLKFMLYQHEITATSDLIDDLIKVFTYSGGK